MLCCLQSSRCCNDMISGILCANKILSCILYPSSLLDYTYKTNLRYNALKSWEHVALHGRAILHAQQYVSSWPLGSVLIATCNTLQSLRCSNDSVMP